MTLLKQLNQDLPRRYNLGIDVGYKEHVVTVISLQTFIRGDDRWKRARCLHFATTRAGFDQLQAFLNRFSSEPDDFLGLCEPTGGYYAATLCQFLLDSGYPLRWIGNATVKHMREKIFQHMVKTDELEARVMARIGYLHEAVGEEFTLQPVQFPKPEQSDLIALCRDYWRLHTMVNRVRNQFAQLMAVIFPELKVFFTSSVSTIVPVTLMTTFPSPFEIAAAPSEAVKGLLSSVRAHQHAKRVDELQQLARTSAGVPPDPGRAWRLRWQTTFLLSNYESLTALEKEITRRIVKRSDYELLAGIPFSGPITIGAILAATGDVQRFANYRQYVAFTGYFAGLETSQTIDRTRMSNRGNRVLKRALFQIAAPLVWFDRGGNVYKELYERKMAEGKPWHKAMPFVCAALARHIYHCLKYDDPYDTTRAFQNHIPRHETSVVELELEEKFETLAAHLWQM